MIKILNFTTKKSFPFINPFYKFSSTADPYYILGVQKTADFKDIKKSFYKLANQYHPDKNDSADAKKKFLLVKQAFEQIKVQKGLMKPQNFVDTVAQDSVRPNADQFTPDQQEGYRSSRDYRIFRQKASMDDKYSQFNSSFQTIHDINDIKIKVEQGQMKDASKRFNLDSMKAKIMVRSQSSMTIIVIGVIGIFIILSFINELFMNSQQNVSKAKVIQTSELTKEQKIQSSKDRIQKIRIQKQNKIKHEQIMKIIRPKQQTKQNNKKSALDQRLAWAKLVQNTKQQFITSNQKVI